MIVIVETTFIIEIVIEQDESAACEEILRLTDPPNLAHLIIPAFSIAEAGMMLERKRGERRDLKQSLARHLNDLHRSRVLAKYGQVLTDLKSELVLAETSEVKRYNDLCARRIGSAQTIEMTQRILTDALMYKNVGIMEKLPDAIVLSTVLSFLDELRAGPPTPVCFVTPDRAFLEPMRSCDCVFLRSFSDAVGWIKKHDPSGGGAI